MEMMTMSGKELDVYQGERFATSFGDSSNVSIDNCKINAMVNQGGTLNQHIHFNNEQKIDIDDFINLSSKKYNLFILDGESFNKEVFVLPRKVCLSNGCTSEEDREKYKHTDEKRIKEIYNMPTIIASTNPDKTMATFGMITQITFFDFCIEFKFKKYGSIKRSVIRNDMDTLGICHTSMYSELDDAHWSMKDINLIGYLADKGFF